MFGDTAEKQNLGSPAHFIEQNSKLPYFLILSAGIMDGVQQDVAQKTSAEYVTRLKQTGHRAAHYHYEKESHPSIVSDINSSGDEPAKAVRAFLKDQPLP